MRLVERFSIIVFSILILVIACFTMFITTGIVDIDIFDNIFNVLSENMILTVCISVFMCAWSIANIFLKSERRNENINGVLLENENGSLLITKDSISNLVESVLKKTSDVKQENVKIEFTTERDIIISLVVSVKDSTVIKEVSARLQENIKMTIKKATDLEVKGINIKIKGVELDKKE